MAMNAWLHEMYKVLGLFIPLIVTHCAILGRAEAFAFQQAVRRSLLDGLMMGPGLTAGLVSLGVGGEGLGAGTVFACSSLLLGEGFPNLETSVIADYKGFLLMALPPGGFLALGFLVAGKRIVDRKLVAGKAAAAGGEAGPEGLDVTLSERAWKISVLVGER